MNLQYTENSILENHDHLLKRPKINDQTDFYSDHKQSKYFIALQKLQYDGFPYVLIISTFVVASIFHEAGMSDLLSIIYLCIAFYYIVNFRKFYSQNLKMISKLRTYNMWVLFMVIIF